MKNIFSFIKLKLKQDKPSGSSVKFKKFVNIDHALSERRNCRHDSCGIGNARTCEAFSLVEMLMALLVASLLMVALAPVITRHGSNNELKVISEAAQYDRDTVISIFTEDGEFNIPKEANQVRVTLMGGGGAGGNAIYDNAEYFSNGEFTVPEGVTKLRVFMVAGGGAGASGAVETNTAYGTLTGTTNSKEFAGNTSANTGVKTWPIPSSAKGNVPALDPKCLKTNPNLKVWNLINQNKDGTLDLSRTAHPGDTVVNVQAVGGGGGGAGGACYVSNTNNCSNSCSGAGGSGGYVNQRVAIPATYGEVNITIGGGGGGGGGEDNCGSSAIGWGGGGGGSEYSTTCTRAGVYPGGTGGQVYTNACHYATIHGKNGTGTVGGGDGVSYSTVCGNTYSGTGTLDGGGGGGGGWSGGGGGGGGGATFFGRYAYSTTDDKDFFLVAPGGGGGGSGAAGGGGGGLGGGTGGFNSGGKGGVNGNNGNYGSNCAGGANPISGINYGAGGNAGRYAGSNVQHGAQGQNGYLNISWGPFQDVLQCQYSLIPNAGGGGGSGQIWFGEIPVSGGQTLNITVGTGGSPSSSYGTSGGDGGNTIIKIGSSEFKVIGGEGGKYVDTENSSIIQASAGEGRGLKTTGFINWANLKSDKLTIFDNDKNGGQGKLVSDGAGGGKGGASIDRFGNALEGGNGGNAQANGADALSARYGSGGGGGGGVIADGGTPGLGGKGAPGYVYIEWGGTNASGGTMGEFVRKTFTNLDPNDRKIMIKVGKGGSNSGYTVLDEDGNPVDITDDTSYGKEGKGGETTVTAKSGGKMVTYTARGGLRGNDGGMETVPNKDHGKEVSYPISGALGITIGYSDDYKEYVTTLTEAAINGAKGEDDHGGMGGYIESIFKTKKEDGTTELAKSVKANDGSDKTIGPSTPGCGGSSIINPVFSTTCNAYAGTVSPNGGNGTFGAGGGGGAVYVNTAGSGGNGGNGFVILEYKSVNL